MCVCVWVWFSLCFLVLCVSLVVRVCLVFLGLSGVVFLGLGVCVVVFLGFCDFVILVYVLGLPSRAASPGNHAYHE